MFSMYSTSNTEAGNGQTELRISGTVRADVRHTKCSQRWNLLKVSCFTSELGALGLAGTATGQEPALIKSAAMETKPVCSEFTTKMTPSGDAIHRRHALCCPRNAAQLRGKWTCIFNRRSGAMCSDDVVSHESQENSPSMRSSVFCLLVGLPYAMAHCLSYPTVGFFCHYRNKFFFSYFYLGQIEISSYIIFILYI